MSPRGPRGGPDFLQMIVVHDWRIFAELRNRTFYKLCEHIMPGLRADRIRPALLPTLALARAAERLTARKSLASPELQNGNLAKLKSFAAMAGLHTTVDAIASGFPALWEARPEANTESHASEARLSPQGGSLTKSSPSKRTL